MENFTHVILLVEDEEDDVFLLKAALEESKVNASVQIAPDGQEAINYLAGEGSFANREKFPLPSLVLLDLKLPRKPGIEVLRWIKRRKVLAPVIVFTSSASKADVEGAYEAGAASYVVKPLTVEARRKFATLLKEYWLGCNQFAGKNSSSS